MKIVQLTNSDSTFIVDDEDYEEVIKHKWYLEKSRSKTYPRTRINNKLVRIHRFIMNPKIKEEVDHRDNNTLNNCRSNLRICSRSNNLQNVNKIKKECLSKYKGVSFHRNVKTKPWHVKIGNKQYGRYDTEIEAAKAYDNIIKELRGEFSNLNFKD